MVVVLIMILITTKFMSDAKQPRTAAVFGYNALLNEGKGKVVYGQEPPSGESTTTESGVNYQLLEVITEAAQWGTPSCSQPQPATDNGVRDGRSN